MKINIQYLLILILLISGLQTIGQRNADELLKQVIDKTRSYENLKVDFTYSMVNEKAGINEEKKGSLFLKDNAYKITFDAQIVLSDGKTVWTYLEESNEVMISDVEEGEDVMTPNSLLTSYYTDYKASFFHDKNNDIKGLKTIELKPSVGKKFTKIQLGISESKLQLINLSVFDNGGNTFVYDLSKMTPNVVLAKDFFQFDQKKYPGVDIVDMR
ncbi:MAG: hypothetical protein CVT92_01210 [Bacteroidetes bacterium HGW-Bacteroidetes-1]|jgi:outer membrane lipoprotein-sorting protein|nr:MAG: hypothetical protein CVT92_01210 [Bacteroidetes bacterium HGW-Bacteroidetes-1]